MTPMANAIRICAALTAFSFAVITRAQAHQELSAEAVTKGLKQFFAKTARADGSFQPGIKADYPGMSDSAYSDLAPTVYAVILHRPFGWPLPHEERTKA